MVRGGVVAAVLGALLTVPSQAQAQYVETVTSSVFEAPDKDRASLTRRASTCLIQSAGTAGQSVQTDVEAGTVVGAALFSYSQAGIAWSVRSTLTAEAKDGRFRLVHSGLTHKQGGPAASRSAWSAFLGSKDQGSEGGWMPVGKWRFAGGERAEAAAQALSQKIATCVQAAPAADNW